MRRYGRLLVGLGWLVLLPVPAALFFWAGLFHISRARGALVAHGALHDTTSPGVWAALAVVYLVWIVLLMVGGVWALDRLGYHYQAYDRPRRATRRERRRRRRRHEPAAGARAVPARCAPQDRRGIPAGGARRRRRRRRRPRKAADPGAHRQSEHRAGLAAADMLEVVGQYTELKKAGANYMGRCPFHEEKTPSFSVDPAEKLYYCFGCGEGGDLLSFVEKKENLDFAGAVEELADRFGVQLEYEESSAAADAERHRRERLRRFSSSRATTTSACCGKRRRRAAPARTSPGAASARRSAGSSAWGTRCRPGRSCATRPARRASANTSSSTPASSCPGKRGGVYDRFRGRLMFPLADERGRMLGFGARTLGDEKPKYLNSPETPALPQERGPVRPRQGPHERRQARPPVRGRRVHRRHGAGAGRRDQRGGRHGHRLHRAAAQAPHPPHPQPLPVLRRRRGRPGGHEPRPRAGPPHGATMHVVRVPDGLDPADYVLAGNDGDAFRMLAADGADIATVPGPLGACHSRSRQARRTGTRVRTNCADPRAGGDAPRA